MLIKRRKKYTRSRLPAGYANSFSKDGSMLAFLGTRLRIVDYPALHEIAVSKPFANLSSVTWIDDQNKVLLKNTSGLLAIVDIPTGNFSVLNTNFQEGCTPIYDYRNHHLIDGSWKGSITTLSSRNGKQLDQRHISGELVTQFSMDAYASKVLISMSPRVREDEDVRDNEYFTLEGLPFGKSGRSRIEFETSACHGVLASNGRHFAFYRDILNKKESERLGQLLCIADTSSHKIIATAKDIEWVGSADPLRWSPDGNYLASACRNDFVIREALALEVVARIEANFPRSVSFHSNSRTVALGTAYSTILFDLDAHLH